MSTPSLSPRELLELMLGHLGFVFEIEEIINGDHLTLNIRTREPGRLIGRDGHTLDDLQYLVNRLTELQDPSQSPAQGEGEGGRPRVTVDVEGYKQKEHADFLNSVRERAARVKRTGEPEKLPPMNSFERFTVHQAFKDDPDVRTRSVQPAGSRLKYIVIEPRKG